VALKKAKPAGKDRSRRTTVDKVNSNTRRYRKSLNPKKAPKGGGRA
jgi:hypothetical protein